MFTIVSRLTNQNLIQGEVGTVSVSSRYKILANSGWHQVAWRQPLLLLNYFLQSSSNLVAGGGGVLVE